MKVIGQESDFSSNIYNTDTYDAQNPENNQVTLYFKLAFKVKQALTILHWFL